jgi:hypothetical protein
VGCFRYQFLGSLPEGVDSHFIIYTTLNIGYKRVIILAVVSPFLETIHSAIVIYFYYNFLSNIDLGKGISYFYKILFLSMSYLVKKPI